VSAPVPPSASAVTSPSTEPDADLIGRLLALASRWTGVSTLSIHAENVRRAARTLLAAGMTPQALLAGAERGDPEVVESLRKAVSIGETYFFRYPEQFQLVERLLRAALPRSPGDAVRAWSAGCATGEEAYSIAALLNHLREPGSPSPSVLGTDHLAAHVEAARVGVYRSWSVRGSGPIAYPLLREVDASQVTIRDELRPLVRFAVHNLLKPAPEAGFDLIFCRNVFIYYDPPAVRALVEHLIAALAPRGILVFGLADPVTAPAALSPAGPPELRVYTRASAIARASRPRRATGRVRVAPSPSPSLSPPPSSPPSVRSGPSPAAPAAADHLAMHLEVLRLMEVGERGRSEALLAQIRRVAPDYLPGCLEQALLHVRLGQKRAARGCLAELLDRLKRMPDDLILAGPEALAVSYYRAAGEALLGQLDGGGG
jgi:chemotaxis protein methyltransferase CheR